MAKSPALLHQQIHLPLGRIGDIEHAARALVPSLQQDRTATAVTGDRSAHHAVPARRGRRCRVGRTM
ncbi:hypothetical protein [Exiguobacterium sp. 8H]|uniref:hypothetical protein n=1 Tax=Exiguobacterium sp. 8H TaxID=2653140 RepID=UPI00135BC3E9|nr:hypothetical protein [Exiguobacterium sp. 8H]